MLALIIEQNEAPQFEVTGIAPQVTIQPWDSPLLSAQKYYKMRNVRFIGVDLASTAKYTQEAKLKIQQK